METHIRGEHHFDDGVADITALLVGQATKDVELGQLHQLKHVGHVAVLEDTAIVVQGSQVGGRLDVEGVVDSWVIVVMDSRGEQGGEDILQGQVALLDQPTALEDEMGNV